MSNIEIDLNKVQLEIKKKNWAICQNSLRVNTYHSWRRTHVWWGHWTRWSMMVTTSHWTSWRGTHWSGGSMWWGSRRTMRWTHSMGWWSKVRFKRRSTMKRWRWTPWSWSSHTWWTPHSWRTPHTRRRRRSSKPWWRSSSKRWWSTNIKYRYYTVSSSLKTVWNFKQLHISDTFLSTCVKKHLWNSSLIHPENCSQKEARPCHSYF